MSFGSHNHQPEVYIDDDEIQKTAQDLLNQWMTENVDREKEERQLCEQLDLEELENSNRFDSKFDRSSENLFREDQRGSHFAMFNGGPDGFKSTKHEISPGFASKSRSKDKENEVKKSRRSTMFGATNSSGLSGSADNGGDLDSYDFKRKSVANTFGNEQFNSHSRSNGYFGSDSNYTQASNYNGALDSSFSKDSELNKKFNELEEKYELMTVDSILDGILNKQFDQNKHIMKNLGFKNEKTQPTGGGLAAKMELRHQEIVKKREERLKKVDTNKKEKEVSRETEMAARKILLEEEKLQIEQKAAEEKKIKEEMEKIRREIHEQQTVMREQQKRDFALRQAEIEKDKLKLESKRQKENMEKLALEKTREENKRKIAARMEQVKIKEMKINMHVLQKHFHAWYNFIIDQRLKIGKAVALSEWRLLSRIYNTWKHKTVQKQCEVEAVKHELNMKRSVHFEKMANEFNRVRLLKKCFSRWTVFVTISHEELDIQKEAENRKERLEKFLDAAKSGKLWHENSVDNEENEHFSSELGDTVAFLENSGHRSTNKTQRTVTNRSNSSSFKSEKIFKMFNSKPNGVVTSTPRLNNSGEGSKMRGNFKVETPSMPWQIRKGIASDLTIEQLEQIGQSTKKAINDSAKQVQEKLTEKQTAQQKQLQQQENILKDQQKVINQLQKQLVSNKKVGDFFANDLCGTPHHVSEPCGTLYTNSVTSAASEVPSGRSEVSSTISRATSASAVKHDPIVSAMEERDRIRQEKRAKFEAIKRKREEEKLRLAKLEQEDLEQKLLEEKRVAAEKKRQELLQQKELERKKAEANAKLQALNAKADEFNEKRLVKYYGVKPWIRLVKLAESNEVLAKNCFAKKICGNCFAAWRQDAKNSAELKQNMAEELNGYFLIRRHFKSWRRYKQISDILMLKAERHFARVLKKNFFKQWVVFTDQRRIESVMNLEIAEKHNEERLSKRCLKAWRLIPGIEKAERERINRRAELRSLVAQIIPDFKGTSNSEEQNDSLEMESTPILGAEVDQSERDQNDYLHYTSFDLRK